MLKKDLYYLYVRMSNLLDFYQKVGFTVTRKQKRLEKILRRRMV